MDLAELIKLSYDLEDELELRFNHLVFKDGDSVRFVYADAGGCITRSINFVEVNAEEDILDGVDYHATAAEPPSKSFSVRGVIKNGYS
jgi:hypothetical protein